MKPLSLAIVGVTGAVGQKFLEVLQERQIPIQQLVLFASSKSAGKKVRFQNRDYVIESLTESSVERYSFDYVLIASGNDVSLQFSPLFAKKKAVVIDNSSAFRMDPKVPLVVPEVNAQDAWLHQGIIANPNCSTVQAVVALKPLHDAYTLKRMVISTYQAVSGAGSEGMIDLVEQRQSGNLVKFPYPIHQNLIPHIDDFLDNGNTKEEQKIINETRKIMHLPQLAISSTAVRVPVLNAHSESINLQFEKPFSMEDIKTIYQKSPGIILMDDPSNLVYPTPLIADGHDEVFIGRIRLDNSIAHGLNLFVVSDNLRKGAATNAIQIMQWLEANKH
jgi:aspartate-semialdehyde dehydrogenase